MSSSDEWYLKGTARLEVRIVEKGMKGVYRLATYKSHDAKSVDVTFADGATAKVPKGRVRPLAPTQFNFESWKDKLQVEDHVDCKVDGDWWPTKLAKMPTKKGLYKLRSEEHQTDFNVPVEDMRPDWKFKLKDGEWEKMNGEQCFSSSCMTLASSSPLWSIAKKVTITTIDGLSTFSSFKSLKQRMTNMKEKYEVKLNCMRTIGTGNTAVDIPVKMEFYSKNVIAATSKTAKLEATWFECAVTDRFDVHVFHVDSKGTLAELSYTSESEMLDDIFLGEAVFVSDATERDVVEIKSTDTGGCKLTRETFAIEVRISHPHVPIFAWSKSLKKLVAVNMIFVRTAVDKGGQASLQPMDVEAGEAVEPDPTDVCQITWPKLMFRVPYTLENDLVLNHTHSREEWLESGFLSKTVETLVAQHDVKGLYYTPLAVTMRSLKIYWMRWLTSKRLLVIFVHPAGGRKSLMGVNMSLSDVYKIHETREWIESLDNTIINICRPRPAPVPIPLLQGDVKKIVASSILFPDAAYRPAQDMNTLLAYTELLKKTYPDASVRRINFKKELCDFQKPVEDKVTTYSRGRVGLPLFGSGMSVTIRAAKAAAIKTANAKKEAELFLHSGGASIGIGIRFELADPWPKSVDDDSKLLLVGRELSWLSCMFSNIHPSRWFDEAENAALHALVEHVGGFVGRISMKRLRSFDAGAANVWWVVYPRTAVTVTKDKKDKTEDNPTVLGDEAFPNEPPEQVYIKKLRNARTPALTSFYFEKILGVDKVLGKRVLAFHGKGDRSAYDGLALAAQHASTRGSEKSSNLLFAVELSDAELKRYEERTKAETAALESAKEKERMVAEAEHPEACKAFHADTQIARREVRFEEDDPILKYKKAMDLRLNMTKRAEEDGKMRCQGGRVFFDLDLQSRHLVLGFIFNQFRSK